MLNDSKSSPLSSDDDTFQKSRTDNSTPELDLLNKYMAKDLAVEYYNTLCNRSKIYSYKIEIINYVIKFLSFLKDIGTQENIKSTSELKQHVSNYVDKIKSNGKSKQSQRKIIGETKAICKFLLEHNFFSHLENISYLEIDFNQIFTKTSEERRDILHFKLRKNCPSEEIHKYTLHYISSKKVEKNYLRPIVNAFEKIREISPVWSESSIQNGLTLLRSKLIAEKGPISTTYQEFQTVLAYFESLKLSQNIQNHIILPKNIRRPSNASSTRVKNPTLGKINYDTLNKCNELKSAECLIDEYYSHLTLHLDKTIDTCREYVLECFKSYCLIQSKEKQDKKSEKIKAALEIINKSNTRLVRDFTITSEYEKLGITKEILQQNNGMTINLVSAMQAIITDEIGINPQSLYTIKVTPHGTKSEYIIVEKDGSIRLSVLKWRQRSLQRRSITSSQFALDKNITTADIDASFCIQYALHASKEHRKTINSNQLWVYENSKAITNAPKGFDYAFRGFSNRNLPDYLQSCSPTIMKIRTSRAIEIYIRTQGDIIQTASYLGNRVKTSLNTYIPIFLQEIIYRRKISAFQHLYLIIATANIKEKLSILNMSNGEYDDCVKTIYENKDFGGDLFECLSNKTKDININEYFFICSPKNFAYAIRYVNTNRDKSKTKYKVCSNALKKASNGSIMIKKILREAEEMVKTE